MAEYEVSEEGWSEKLRARPLSRNFTAADLCCVGETWERTRIPNRPEQDDSWSALIMLCEAILEPVAARFGRPTITYGFASRQLMSLIPANKAPALDQHASCELNTIGKPICTRRGAAADFLVKGVDSGQLAVWIAENLAFDRLYFYGSDRPLHVSAGPDRTGGIVTMFSGPSGKRVPRNLGMGRVRTLLPS